jgi:L-malate glycosyltransferase
MHILIIPSWYPKKRNLISGSFFKEQAEALAKRGHEVGVIYPEERILRFNKEYSKSDLGIRCESVNNVFTLRSVMYGKLPKKSFTKSHSIWTNDGLTLFSQYLETQGLPDIIHVHSALNGGLVARKIKKKFNIPYVLTEHSTAYQRNLFSEKEKILIRKVLDDSSQNIVVSPALEKSMNSFLNKQYTYRWIPNMVNDIFFKQLPSKKTNDFKFISVGGLTIRKGFDGLITSFHRAFKDSSNVMLNIIGSGPEELNLRRKISILGLENKIKMRGQLSREKIAAELTQSDCFVLNSDYETFGVVLIEAMAVGLPVITSSCGGPNYIINDNSVGSIFPNRNLDSLTEELKQMYKNHKKYNRNNIKNSCREKYSEEAVTESLIKTYSCIIGN